MAKYKALVIWNVVPWGNIRLAILEFWIKFTKPDTVLKLVWTNFKFEKYFLSQRMCYYTINETYILIEFIVNLSSHYKESESYNKIKYLKRNIDMKIDFRSICKSIKI